MTMFSQSHIPPNFLKSNLFKDRAWEPFLEFHINKERRNTCFLYIPTYSNPFLALFFYIAFTITLYSVFMLIVFSVVFPFTLPPNELNKDKEVQPLIHWGILLIVHWYNVAYSGSPTSIWCWVSTASKNREGCVSEFIFSYRFLSSSHFEVFFHEANFLKNSVYVGPDKESSYTSLVFKCRI